MHYEKVAKSKMPLPFKADTCVTSSLKFFFYFHYRIVQSISEFLRHGHGTGKGKDSNT